MSKPVSTQEMFDLWQKMVNPGAYPLQSLMFPVLDPKELDKKVAELAVVEHWLRANVNMVQLTIKSLQFQRDMLKGGEKAMQGAEGAGDMPNPALWASNTMADAAKSMPPAPTAPEQEKKKRSRKR